MIKLPDNFQILISVDRSFALLLRLMGSFFLALKILFLIRRIGVLFA